MSIIAIDPGITTGMVVIERHAIYPYSATTTEELARYLQWHTGDGLTGIALIENFIGGGYRTAEAVGTLKTLGFCEYYLRYMSSYPHPDVVLRAPQLRKPYVQTAKRILDSFAPEYTIHTADALAHVISYMKENPELEHRYRSSPICRLLELPAEQEA